MSRDNGGEILPSKAYNPLVATDGVVIWDSLGLRVWRSLLSATCNMGAPRRGAMKEVPRSKIGAEEWEGIPRREKG